MKTVNLGDKYTHRVTLRLNDAQYDFLLKISSILGVSPSDYIRMTVNSGMVSSSNQIDTLYSGDLLKGTVGTDEDVKANINDFV